MNLSDARLGNLLLAATLGRLRGESPFSDAQERQLVELARPEEFDADTPTPDAPFQVRVSGWMAVCFGPSISADRLERGDRLLEEVLELLQSGGYPCERVAFLRDYVYSRPAGEPAQEVGGVMVTLAAYCLAFGLDMQYAAETELTRVWSKVAEIRAKQAAKPRGSALPVAVPVAEDGPPPPPAEMLAKLDAVMSRSMPHGSDVKFLDSYWRALLVWLRCGIAASRLTLVPQNAEVEKLVAFFNEPAPYVRWGHSGDHDMLAPADTAIRALRARLAAERSLADNGLTLAIVQDMRAKWQSNDAMPFAHRVAFSNICDAAAVALSLKESNT